jgi:hypothetical protein
MNLQERYAKLAMTRDHYVTRARHYASLTIPSILPPSGHNESQILPETYQSFGAKAVSNLAAKLMLSLLPPGASSFKMSVPPKVVLESGELTVPPEIHKQLTQVEDLINAKIETLKWRRPTFTTLTHLIVTGNMLEVINPDGGLVLYRLDQFVCLRNSRGQVLEIIACEKVRRESLPDQFKRSGVQGDYKPDEEVELYTLYKPVDETSYEVQQDLNTTTIKTLKTYTGVIPANAIPWSLVPGEHYGRPHVEVHFADLRALDHYAKSETEGFAMASRNVILVRPNAAGGNLRKRIQAARNGDVISGSPDDAAPFQFANGAQLTATSAAIERITRGIASAFMMTGELRRDAERVTAFELRQLAQEIEIALGGAQTVLSSEMMNWRLRKLFEIMRNQSEVPALQDGAVDMTVTTGLEALGRDETINKVRLAFELLGAANQYQQAISDYIKFDAILTPGMSALGFASAIRTAAEVEERQAQLQEQQAMQQMAVAATAPVAQAVAQSEEL